MIIRLYVDDGRPHCSDENEVLPTFVADVRKLPGSENHFVMPPLPSYFLLSSFKHIILPNFIEYSREAYEIFSLLFLYSS